MNTLALLSLLNETLTATIVVVAFSMLLYNLSRNFRDRVTRTSAAVLACVTAAYVGDVFIALDPTPTTYQVWLRFQWLGIAMVPTTLFHLSDALLATTGLPSRGRRRRVVRLFYGISTIFLVLAAFTDLLVFTLPLPGSNLVSLRAGPLFGVYSVFFAFAVAFACVNVWRARQRCLTRATRRRMTYLLAALPTPALGIFPYAVLLGPGTEFDLGALLLVNVANVVVVLTLVFLSYPLSFFGSREPDRVVRADLLSFFLRGPATGLLALVTILYTSPATAILGLRGDRFMPFAVVAVVLLWQWMVALALPWLERWVLFRPEDDDLPLHTLGDRLLSRADLLQLLDAVLQACVNALQVERAFVAEDAPEGAALLAHIGPPPPTDPDDAPPLQQAAPAPANGTLVLARWQGYWLTPLMSQRVLDPTTNVPLRLGILGVQAHPDTAALGSDALEALRLFANRAARTLDDLVLQRELAAALEGLLPQLSAAGTRATELEFLPGRTPAPPRSSLVDDEVQFSEMVKAALKHYWGGPGLASSGLLRLHVVRAQTTATLEPAQALRAVLLAAVERLRPPGERSTTQPAWTLYNILSLRYIENVKVRDAARRMALSESDFYRKQREALAALSDVLRRMEHDVLADTATHEALTNTPKG